MTVHDFFFFREFKDLLNRAPEFQDMLMSDEEKTLFAPSNDAIRQIPREIMNPVKSNVTAITEVIITPPHVFPPIVFVAF